MNEEVRSGSCSPLGREIRVRYEREGAPFSEAVHRFAITNEDGTLLYSIVGSGFGADAYENARAFALEHSLHPDCLGLEQWLRDAKTS
jgi:hypothetical protein